jgi:hypothetical protein
MIMQRSQFVGPLVPVRYGNKIIEFSNKTKLLGVLIDKKLSWKEHVDKVHKSFSSQIRVLRKTSYLPSRLLEEIYFKTIIPHVTYYISVWGNCSVSMFTKMESLHIKAGRIIHKILQNTLDCDVLECINWQDLGYLYKRRLAIELFKVKQGMNKRLLPFFTFTESKHKGPLLAIKRTKTEFGRNSLELS